MILVIEASAEPASICYFNGYSTQSLTFANENKVNEVLFTELEKLLKGAEKVSQVVVGLGPGSYSGARVGLAAAQAFSLYHQCPLSGLNSLSGVTALQAEAESVIVGDARRNGYYLVYLKAGVVEHVSEIFTHEEFQTQLANLNPQISLYSFEKPERFKSEKEITQITPSAEGLLHAWNQLDSTEQEKRNESAPVVNYMRPAFITQSKKSL